MKQRFTQWLSLLMAVCLLLSLAPAALMEEIPAEEIIAEPAEAAVAEEAEDVLSDEEAVEVEDEFEFSDPDEAELPVAQEAEDASDIVMEASGDADELLLAAASGSIPIDAAHFPDAVFRSFISENYDVGDAYAESYGGYDYDGNAVSRVSDGYLSPVEIENADDMDLRFAEGTITNLKGVEYFPNVGRMICNETAITSLDVSSVKSLYYLGCDFCKNLTSLKLGSLSKLRGLGIIGCEKLASVDISQCSTLMSNISGREPVQKTGNWGPDMEITYYEWGWHTKEESYNIEYSSCTKIITKSSGSSSSSSTPTPTPTSSPVVNPTPTSVQTVTVARKNVKATAYVGKQYKIDLNGATAKSFKSSKKKVATVDGNGIVTPRAQGKTKITIRIGKKKRVLTLTVKDPTIPTRVTLNMSGTVPVKKGTSVTLTATLPAGTNSGIKWKSSNKKIATVKNGVVTFKKKGKVTITATATRGKKKARVKFKVSK